MLTNKTQPLTAEQIVNEYSDEPPVEVADGESNDDKNDDNGESTTLTTPPMRNDIDEAIKMLIKLSFFTDDVEFQSLLSKLARKITQKNLQTMRHSSIDMYFIPSPSLSS